MDNDIDTIKDLNKTEDKQLEKLHRIVEDVIKEEEKISQRRNG